MEDILHDGLTSQQKDFLCKVACAPISFKLVGEFNMRLAYREFAISFIKKTTVINCKQKHFGFFLVRAPHNNFVINIKRH